MRDIYPTHQTFCRPRRFVAAYGRPSPRRSSRKKRAPTEAGTQNANQPRTPEGDGNRQQNGRRRRPPTGAPAQPNTRKNDGQNASHNGDDGDDGNEKPDRTQADEPTRGNRRQSNRARRTRQRNRAANRRDGKRTTTRQGDRDGKNENDKHTEPEPKTRTGDNGDDGTDTRKPATRTNTANTPKKAEKNTSAQHRRRSSAAARVRRPRKAGVSRRSAGMRLARRPRVPRYNDSAVRAVTEQQRRPPPPAGLRVCPRIAAAWSARYVGTRRGVFGGCPPVVSAGGFRGGAPSARPPPSTTQTIK